MRRRIFLAAGGTLISRVSPAHAAAQVDLLLVLAVDVSRSIDEEEAELQRQGYRMAMTDPAVLAAAGGGPHGAIAVADVEWAAASYQSLVIPWTRIAGSDDGTAWSDRLARSPRKSITWTSISGALAFSRQALADSPFEGTRRVIDVSGDGPNNNGPLPEPERDRLVLEGVTINGLPIVNDRPDFGRVKEGLEPYYRNSVIGGPGAFVIVAEDFAAFGSAIRRKLIKEITKGPWRHIHGLTFARFSRSTTWSESIPESSPPFGSSSAGDAAARALIVLRLCPSCRVPPAMLRRRGDTARKPSAIRGPVLAPPDHERRPFQRSRDPLRRPRSDAFVRHCEILVGMILE
jgi:hypothetical protein